jgi:hypothetical protein
MGGVVAGAMPYNPMWPFHLDEKSINFFEYAIELCDGTPGSIQNDFEHWIKTVRKWCPWGSKLEKEVTREVIASRNQVCPAVIKNYTTKECLGFFSQEEFPFSNTICQARACVNVPKEIEGEY